MPDYNVSLKDGASDADLEQAKKMVTDQGGKVTKTFSLVKGFTFNTSPDTVQTLLNSFDTTKVEIEEDKDVGTW